MPSTTPAHTIQNSRLGLKELARWRRLRVVLSSGGMSALIAGVAVRGQEPPPPPSPDAFDWKVVVAEGREYVTAADVAAFYHFDRHFDEGWATWFRSPTLAMRWEVESSMLIVNDTKFVLSGPCLKRDGEVLLSRTDLVKWVDPLLRPWHLRDAEWFDTVVIDPGHGGVDNGTHGPLGDEKAYTLDVCQRLAAALTERNLKVVMTRQTDVRVDKQLRGELASEVGGSIFVSLHFNQNASHVVRGLETYAMTPVGLRSSNDGQTSREATLGFAGNLRENASLALAAAVHSQILHRCRQEDRGVRRARFAVLKDSDRAGILVEGGYLSSPTESVRINQPDYRTRLATAIAEGIIHYRSSLGRWR